MSRINQDSYWSDAYKGLVFKIVTLALTFFNVRIMVFYLGDNLYGSWITVSSIVSWMGAGDFGIGNGLRNEVSKYYATKNRMGILNAVYSTNRPFFFIALFMFAIIVALSKLLAVYGVIREDYVIPLAVMALFFAVSMFWSRVQAISLGVQKAWYVSLANAIGMLLSIICYVIMMTTEYEPNLLLCSYIYGVVTLAPLFVLTLILRKIDLKIKKGEKYSYDRLLVSRIIRSGLKFYILQLTSLVLFSTDNVIVEYLFGSTEVTRYSLINQVYTVGASFFTIFLDSFWSGVAIHFENKDIDWVTKTIKKLLALLAVFSAGIVIVSLLFNQIINIWIEGNSFEYGWNMILVFAVYCFLSCLQGIFGNINYAIYKTRLIIIWAIISAVVNIPLSILFAKVFHLGIMGVKLATLVSLFPSWIAIIVSTIFYLKGIKKVGLIDK